MSKPPDIPEVKNPEFIRLLNLVDILGREDSQNLLEKFNDNALALLAYLVKEGIGKKDELCRLWGDSIGLAYVDFNRTLFQPEIVRRIPDDFAREHYMIPIYQFGDTVTVAAADPGDSTILRTVEALLGCPVSLVFSFPDDIRDTIDIQYQDSDMLREFAHKIKMNPLFDETGEISTEELELLAGDKGVVEFTRGLFLLSIKEHATDIHIEPGEKYIKIRFRIDGVLQEKMKLDMSLHASIISRLKILADADIRKTGIPWEGQLRLSLLKRPVDFMFSSFPTPYGERVVLRMLKVFHVSYIPELSELHLSKNIYNKFKELIKYPGGIFMIAGPSDSGKTTTVYSALRQMNSPEINIMTLEDPVECRLENICQIQIPHTGLSAAPAIQSLLAQDPDVIFLGQIRNQETAAAAAAAALSGHLVFTTLNANSACDAIFRLIRLGIEPSLAAASLIGVLAQRLVRRLCDQCKERYELSPDEIENIFLWDRKTKVFFHRKKGCPSCN